jgi:hypothetical protein
MIITALAVVAAAIPSCAPVTGAERMWASPATRFVMVGETHGTQEVPQMFADLACAASKTRRLVIALEQPPEDQPAIDAFLKSDGGADARAQFLKARMWTMRDGRSSKAMLKLFERLRQLTQAGRIHGVVAFQAYDLSVPFSNGNEGINRGMAAVLERVAAANPDALVLGYGGSVHMSHDDVPGTAIPSAAGRLPKAQTVSIYAEGDGGNAWNCVSNAASTNAIMECAAHAHTRWGEICKAGVRAVVPLQSGQAPEGFDAVACVGKPFSASPPAVPTAAK